MSFDPVQRTVFRYRLSTAADLIDVDVLDILVVLVLVDVKRDSGTRDDFLREQVDSLDAENFGRPITQGTILRTVEK